MAAASAAAHATLQTAALVHHGHPRGCIAHPHRSVLRRESPVYARKVGARAVEQCWPPPAPEPGSVQLQLLLVRATGRGRGKRHVLGKQIGGWEDDLVAEAVLPSDLVPGVVNIDQLHAVNCQ